MATFIEQLHQVKELEWIRPDEIESVVETYKVLGKPLDLLLLDDISKEAMNLHHINPEEQRGIGCGDLIIDSRVSDFERLFRNHVVVRMCVKNARIIIVE